MYEFAEVNEKMIDEKIVRDCNNCDWYKNGVCKTILPCLSEKLQTLSDAIDDIIRGLQGKAEAEYQRGGGG